MEIKIPRGRGGLNIDDEPLARDKRRENVLEGGLSRWRRKEQRGKERAVLIVRPKGHKYTESEREREREREST